MKPRFLIFILLILLAPTVAAITNETGTLSGYFFDATFYNSSNFIDGDWDTYAVLNISLTPRSLYLNYSFDNYSGFGNAYWKIKYSLPSFVGGSLSPSENKTINLDHTRCTMNPLQLRITVSGTTYYFQCKNDSSNINLFIVSGGSTPEPRLYEQELIYQAYPSPTISYSQLSNLSGTLYSRILSYSLNITCPTGVTFKFYRFINSSESNLSTAICNNQSNIYTSYYTHNSEGPYNISVKLNSTYNSYQIGNLSIISDLTNPTIQLNYSLAEGFSTNNSLNISMRCHDSIYPIQNTSLSLNGDSLINQNLTNNTASTNYTAAIDGENEILASCSDAFGTTTDNRAFEAYFATIYLIDELENIGFDVSNLSSARAYFDDNSTFFDFKSEGINKTNFSSLEYSKLRVELGYDDGALIVRYIDLSLLGEEIRVCANKQGVTHYEQLILGNEVQPVKLKNIFSNCYVAADYTRFAYQDVYLLKAYTIHQNYYLYHYLTDGSEAILANVDGSVSSYIQVNQLEFSKKGYNTDLQTSGLAFEQISGGIIRIYYLDIDGNNENVSLQVINLNNSATVANYSSFTDPNNFTFDINLAPLSDVTNQTVFKIIVTAYDNTGTSTITERYFTPQANSGIIPSEVAITLAILLTIFGYTMTLSRFTFGWLGIFMLIGSIAVLAASTLTAGVLWIMGLEVILLLFNIIILAYQNYPSLST